MINKQYSAAEKEFIEISNSELIKLQENPNEMEKEIVYKNNFIVINYTPFPEEDPQKYIAVGGSYSVIIDKTTKKVITVEEFQ